MAFDTYSGIPSTIAAGDTLSFSAGFSGYPATSYGLIFILSLNGAVVATLNGTPSGDDFIISATDEATASYPPGRYFYAAYVTQGGERKMAQRGQISVTPNFAIAEVASEAQTLLTALNANILALSSSATSSVSFNGQSYTDRDLSQLMKMRNELRAQVQAEQRAKGYDANSGYKTLRTRFVQ